jgi:hypothetical protein
MKCPNCRADVTADSRFCDSCGHALSLITEPASEAPTTPLIPATQSPPPTVVSPSPATNDLLLGSDGVWRWTYELSLLTNPTVFITLIKVTLIASLMPVLLVGGITLFESGLLKSLQAMGQVFAIVLGIMLALMILAYLLIALLFRGKYCVVFEMDSHSITHIQMQKQFQKNQVLAFLTVLAGAAAGNPQTAGAGLLAGSKQSSTSTFAKVKSLVFHPRRHVIYVNETLNKNQVYAPPAFYEIIQKHLIAHCPKAKVVQR